MASGGKVVALRELQDKADQQGLMRSTDPDNRGGESHMP